MELAGRLREQYRRYKKYFKISKSGPIARRYFVMNGFDGALTMLGILLGTYLSDFENVNVLITAGVGAAVALGVSGITSAYMAEVAERRRDLKNLESAMLINLENTIQSKANRFAIVFLSSIDGISPVITSMIILSPFFFLGGDQASIKQAYNLSFGIAAVMFFSLGAYLGKISGESMWKKGSLMLVIGVFTSVLVFITSLI